LVYGLEDAGSAEEAIAAWKRRDGQGRQRDLSRERGALRLHMKENSVRILCVAGLNEMVPW